MTLSVTAHKFPSNRACGAGTILYRRMQSASWQSYGPNEQGERTPAATASSNLRICRFSLSWATFELGPLEVCASGGLVAYSNMCSDKMRPPHSNRIIYYVYHARTTSNP